MKWTNLRIFKGDTYTIGKFFIDGTYFCNVLEAKCMTAKQKIKLNKIIPI
jgi:hypothetical protein